MNHPSMVPRGSGPGSILRPPWGESQNHSPQVGSVHRNNGGLWLTAGMQPLSCPGPQPQGLRSPGQAGWRGSVRQALVCQGQDTWPAGSPLWAGGWVGPWAGPHPHIQPHKGSRAKREEKQEGPKKPRQPPTNPSLGYLEQTQRRGLAALRPKLYITVGRGTTLE